MYEFSEIDSFVNNSQKSNLIEFCKILTQVSTKVKKDQKFRHLFLPIVYIKILFITTANQQISLFDDFFVKIGILIFERGNCTILVFD